MLKPTTNLENVHRIKRHGIGYVYLGQITIGELATALEEGLIQYAPKYQRGYRPSLYKDDPGPDVLLKITDQDLEVDWDRASQMAAKYLCAASGNGSKKLFNPNIVWNARQDDRRPAPEYDADSSTVVISSRITIPDSGHRHACYKQIARWKEDPDSIPDQVEIETNGETVTNTQLHSWVRNLDLYDEEESSILVEVFNLSREEEGLLFDELNMDQVRAKPGRAIDLNPDKDPARRFVYELIDRCEIFARTEIETQTTSIGSKSRKLTTNSTMTAAVKPFIKQVYALEDKNRSGYDDLVEFFCSFYKEWAQHYPEFLPAAKAEDRHALRTRSFALSNIMFFPMFQLAFELWSEYNNDSKNWKSDKAWRDLLARLAGKTEAKLNDGSTGPVEVLARDIWDYDGKTAALRVEGNPAWRGKILIEKFGPDGKSRGWSLSSTRQTRDAAYHYLCQIGMPTTK